MFLVSGANASDTDKHDGSNLAPYEVAIHIDEPPLYTAMNVTNNATPIVKQRWVYSILKELPQFGIVQATNPSCLLYFP